MQTTYLTRREEKYGFWECTFARRRNEEWFENAYCAHCSPPIWTVLCRLRAIAKPRRRRWAFVASAACIPCCCCCCVLPSCRRLVYVNIHTQVSHMCLIHICTQAYVHAREFRAERIRLPGSNMRVCEVFVFRGAVKCWRFFCVVTDNENSKYKLVKYITASCEYIKWFIEALWYTNSHYGALVNLIPLLEWGCIIIHTGFH